MEPFQYTKANITIFRLIDFESTEKKVERDAINTMLDEKQTWCENAGMQCDPKALEGNAMVDEIANPNTILIN